MMSIETITKGAWHVEPATGEPELLLTFRDGQVFEKGFYTGTYEHVGATFVASIGDELRLVVDLDTLEAKMLMKYPDGQVVEEPVHFRRIAAN